MTVRRLLVLLCFYLVPACRTPYGADSWPDERRSDLNLLVITLDTTRADRLGAYGFQEPLTPYLDQLAREGVLFRRTTTSAPLTLPAHCSLFTGLNPPRHGVRDNSNAVLDASQTTLAERLQSRGFRTGAFVASYVLDSSRGLDQGFETYADDVGDPAARRVSRDTLQIPSNRVIDRSIDWIGRNDGHRFFAWVHLYDPHAPYNPPEPYRSKYAGRPYLGEIAFMDGQIGRLRSFLEGRGLLERTVIVVVGDHGESLGEHGEAMHGLFLYQSVMHVPLIVRIPAPFSPQREVAALTRTIDVVPTVLNLLGQPVPDDIDGQSLVPLMTGAAKDLELEAYSESMYPRYHFGWSDLHALQRGSLKLIAAPRPELYDLVKDPDEETNLFDTEPSLARAMTARLAGLEGAASASFSRSTPNGIDGTDAERLRALGYISSAIDEGAGRSTELADPKDQIALYNRIIKAQGPGGYR